MDCQVICLNIHTVAILAHCTLFNCESLNTFALLTVESSVYILSWLMLQSVAPIAPFQLSKFEYSCLHILTVAIWTLCTLCTLFNCQGLNTLAWLTVEPSVYKTLRLLLQPVAPIAPLLIVNVWILLLGWLLSYQSTYSFTVAIPTRRFVKVWMLLLCWM